ncbi:MAG: protein phosphatase 2C domain-containing protein [Planctomycetaceae bacterium]
MSGRMDCFGASHVGLVRENNEDQFLIADLKKTVVIHHTSLSYDDETELLGASQAKLMLVADGVGGNAAGERASSLALEGVVQYLLNAMHWIFRPEDDREEAFLEDLKLALQFSQEKIQYAAAAVPSQQGMGTTITMAYLVWPHVYLVHAGDSRAYLFRNGELLRLTHDQTYAQSLADAGVFTPEQIETSPLNHVLSSLLGCDPDNLNPQVYKSELRINDTLLLCTDGLTRHVSEPQIAALLTAPQPARILCEELIDAANDGGGRDNTTVVVAKFTNDTELHALLAEESAAIEIEQGTEVC